MEDLRMRDFDWC